MTRDERPRVRHVSSNPPVMERPRVPRPLSGQVPDWLLEQLDREGIKVTGESDSNQLSR